MSVLSKVSVLSQSVRNNVQLCLFYLVFVYTVAIQIHFTKLFLHVSVTMDDIWRLWRFDRVRGSASPFDIFEKIQERKLDLRPPALYIWDCATRLKLWTTDLFTPACHQIQLLCLWLMVCHKMKIVVPFYFARQRHR